MAIAIRAGTSDPQSAGISLNPSDSQKQNPKTVNAKDLNIGPGAGSAIDAKRGLARKQARKLVSDAWGRDQKVSNSIADIINEKQSKVSELWDLKRRMNDVDTLKDKYMQEYEIDPESEEQKDLELLEKYQNNKYGMFSDEFSEDEIERLKELQDKPLTEYQQKALSVNYLKDQMSVEYDRLEKKIVGLSESITDAKIEQEKSQDMLNAQDAAETILDAASQEILGMMYEEGKEHLEDEAKEQEERAEKAAKEKEEQEERIEKQKENRAEQEEILHRAEDAHRLEMDVKAEKMTDSQAEEVQKNIQKILVDNHLINEDLKGIDIDLKF